LVLYTLNVHNRVYKNHQLHLVLSHLFTAHTFTKINFDINGLKSEILYTQLL